jgi:hypothetical protein
LTESIDHQAAVPSVAGGLFAPETALPEAEQVDADRPADREAHRDALREAILALADGSVWRCWSVGPARAVTGPVAIAGDLVLVHGDVVGVVRGVDVVALEQHLSEVGPGQGPGTMACLTAPGAILPIHAEVARAIARGEIGRP